jgi:predicted acyltransferase
MVTTTSSVPSTMLSAATKVGGRLESLDVFRGLTIAGMMLVNNAGNWDAIYWPLEHAEWNGWTPTDLIFPFFLFIVGVSMVYSFANRQKKGESRGSLLAHSVRRALLIFAIGLFLNGFPHFQLTTWRIAGVLQRIAIVYLISAVIVLFAGWRVRLAALVACLVGYWALMKFVPVPGFGVGNLSREGNLAAWLDRMTMYNHLYIEHVRDPEGILSTIPAIGTCLLGVFTGERLRSSRSSSQKLVGMLAVGVVGVTLGKLWGYEFPINKNLWTSSYVLFAAGLALLLLGFCYWTIDIKGWKAWGKPFMMMGMNPLALYALASLISHLSINVHIGDETLKSWIYDRMYAPVASPYNASMLYGLTYVVAFLVLGWILYRRQIFLKV